MQLFIDTLKLRCRCLVQLGYNYQHISYLQTTHEHGRAPCSFSLFLNSSVERLSLISLSSYSKEDYLGIRVNLFHGELSVPEQGAMYFFSINHTGKK